MDAERWILNFQIIVLQRSTIESSHGKVTLFGSNFSERLSSRGVLPVSMITFLVYSITELRLAHTNVSRVARTISSESCIGWYTMLRKCLLHPYRGMTQCEMYFGGCRKAAIHDEENQSQYVKRNAWVLQTPTLIMSPAFNDTIIAVPLPLHV